MWIQGIAIVIVVAILASSCAHESKNRSAAQDQTAIYVTPKAVNSDQHSSAAWLAYGIALATFRTDQQSPNEFAREVYARTAAAKAWTQLKQKKTVKPNPDLEALAMVELNGFMHEYVWHYLRRPEWTEPERIRMSEFLVWKKDHLQPHTPILNPGIGIKEVK